MSEGGSGWFTDPARPKLERYFDGSHWTDLTRPAQRKARDVSGGGGGGSRAAVLAIVGVLVVAGAALVWYVALGAKDIAGEEANIATEAPSQANVTAMKADVRAISINVVTTIVDNGGRVPTVALKGRDYVVTGANGTPATSAASQGVTAAGITSTSDQDYCVWVRSADGTTVHEQAGGSAADGDCP